MIKVGIPSSFIDICIISQRDRKIDPRSYLEKVVQIFTRMMPMDRLNYIDASGKSHVKLECRRVQDFTAFVDKWSSFFEKLLAEIPNSLKNSPSKSPPQKDSSTLKQETFLVLKIQTNITRLVNYLLNLVNGIYSLIEIKIFHETVVDGLITYIQDESDFEGFLRPLSNEKTVREYYQKLGIKSEEFLTQREKILNKNM